MGPEPGESCPSQSFSLATRSNAGFAGFVGFIGFVGGVRTGTAARFSQARRTSRRPFLVRSMTPNGADRFVYTYGDGPNCHGLNGSCGQSYGSTSSRSYLLAGRPTHGAAVSSLVRAEQRILRDARQVWLLRMRLE